MEGGIFIPDHYFEHPFPFDRRDGEYRVIELGAPYHELRRALEAIAKTTGVPLKGFGDLSVEEIVKHTGLSFDEAHKANKGPGLDN